MSAHETCAPVALTDKPAPLRAYALDALRGLAIMGMCLSGRLPLGEMALPSWMYHAQNPPPSGKLDLSVAGYTWVDLVFPAFLFSMGVAFPFAMAGRLAKGANPFGLAWGSFLRFLSLSAFGIYFSHVIPTHFSAESSLLIRILPFSLEVSRSLIGLFAFAIPFLIFCRLPEKWPPVAVWATRIAGVLLAVGMISMLRYGSAGLPFSVRRQNIILMVLANMALAGSVIWLLTRGSQLLRLGIMALLFAALLAWQQADSWVRAVIVYPIPIWKDLGWLTQFSWHKYLLIVIPGTIVGDRLLDWMKGQSVVEQEGPLRRRTLHLLAALLAVFVVLAMSGLQARLSELTTLMTFAVATITLLVILPRATNRAEGVLLEFCRWGFFWLVLGLLFEPFDGGIKKSAPIPLNFSYYFVSLGLSILLLVSLTCWIDLLGGRRWFHVLIANGQNPMLAYLGINNLMEPLFQLSGLSALAAKSLATPWLLAAWELVKTITLGIMVAIFTRYKLFWRT